MKTFKHFIRIILDSLGLEIHRKSKYKKISSDFLNRIYVIRTSMSEFLDQVIELGFSPTTVIDVGAAYGTFALYEKFSQSRHLLIEPLQEFEASLSNICKQYNAEYVLAAAGPKNGTIDIYVSADLLGSSIFKEDDKSIIREVPVVTLDKVCKERELQVPYVLKVDVQGAELLALDGAKTVLKDAEIVILEASFFHFVPDMPDFYDVLDYMKKRGFVVYDIFGGHNRPLDGARAQADVAFVKENGIFRKYYDWATPNQRTDFYRRTKHSLAK